MSSHGAFYLLFLRAGYQNEPVEPAVTARFYQYGCFDHRNATGVFRGNLLQQMLFESDDVRVDDAVQLRKPFRITEDLVREDGPRNSALLIENAGAEFREDGIERGASAREHCVAEDVGIDEMATECRERFSNEALAAGEAAG
jgi:hypothetical protein